MKKIIECLIVALVFLCSSAFADWDGSSSEPKNTREIDGKVFYEISSPEELAWFAEQVNGGETTLNAVLVNDIKFMDDTSKRSSVNWTPIGGFGTNYSRFGGVFDGAEYTIYGLYSYQKKAGLFGVTERKSVVKNVKMANSVVRGGSDKQVGGESYVGGIVAFNNGTVMNCSNRDSLDWGNNAMDLYVGGIVGWNAGTVVDCVNDGTVPIVSYRWHYNYRDYYHDSYSGGIVGWNEGSVTNCINRGVVFDKGIRCVTNNEVSSGGIVGWNEGSVTGCLNEGAISSDYRYSGGIVGRNRGLVTKGVNRGSVSVSNYPINSITYSSFSGGIAGRNDSIITNCWNSGRLINWSRYAKENDAGLVSVLDSGAKIYNSYSVGDSANSGVVYDAKGEVINSFYDSDVLSGKKTDSSNVGMHTADMQADRFAWILNTTNGTDSNSNIWSRDSVGYPIFADSVYKPIYRIIFIDNGDTIERYTNYKGQVEFPELRVPAGKVFTYWRSSVLKDVIEKRMLNDVVFTEDQTVDVVYQDTTWAWFMIYFFDADSNFISSALVRYGEIPVCRITPTKKSTDEYTYKFVGWRPEVTAVTEEFDYYAVFDSTRIIPEAVPITVAPPAWSVTASGRNFQVHAAPVGKSYALFDLQGKVLAKGRIESSEMIISAPRAGSYIVRVGERSVRVNAR